MKKTLSIILMLIAVIANAIAEDDKQKVEVTTNLSSETIVTGDCSGYKKLEAGMFTEAKEGDKVTLKEKKTYISMIGFTLTVLFLVLTNLGYCR